ncbi:MAG TPA: DUF4265 domain-containing protein [Spongiibacteraceae bacterium]|nr:DUF4265 domain-containing protein [Spongiibacteraceae bacterium]
MESGTKTVELKLLAGMHPNGQPVLENVRALQQSDDNTYRLLQSPLFVTGAACGDLIELLNNNPGRFRVRERSGQLAVRVLSRDDVGALAEELTPAVEKLDGTLDVQAPRALVYSIHVAVGFAEIERVFDAVLSKASAAQWSYGNVYDPETGAPLNWWETLLNP